MSDVIAGIANIVTAFGLPIAILTFAYQYYKDRKDRELETYRSLSQRYFDYLGILLNNSSISTTETDWARGDSSDRDPKQDLVVQMAVNLIETAFYMYRDHESEFRQAQWHGWKEYLQDWCSHPAFQARWPEVIDQYDADFRSFVHTAYNKVHAPVPNAQ